MLPKSTTLNSDDDMTSNCTCNGRESIWVDWFALSIHTKPEVIIEFDTSDTAGAAWDSGVTESDDILPLVLLSYYG